MLVARLRPLVERRDRRRRAGKPQSTHYDRRSGLGWALALAMTAGAMDLGAGVSDRWSVVCERVLGRMLVVVACVLGVGGWSACGAADARAARLSVHAVPGGRVGVRLRGPVGSGAHDFRLDGKRLLRTRRRAITVLVARRRAGDPLARWRVVKVRRVGSRRVLARARFALGVARSRAAPTLVLLKAPPPRMTGTRAVLRFSVEQPHGLLRSRRLALPSVLEPDRLPRSLLRLAQLPHSGCQPTRNHEDPSRLDGPRPVLGHTASGELARTAARYRSGRAEARLRGRFRRHGIEHHELEAVQRCRERGPRVAPRLGDPA